MNKKFRHIKTKRGTKTEQGIFYLTLARAPVNALNTQCLDELTEALRALAQDDKTKLVIINGAGDNFSAGADLKEEYTPPSNRARWQKNHGRECIEAILALPQISFCVLHGYALGGAAVIASACDFRLGALDTKIGYPEILHGMNLNWLGLPLLRELVGIARAKEMVISGAHYDAPALHQMGFLDALYGEKTASAVLKTWTQKFLDRPALPAQMMKKSLNVLAYSEALATMHMDYDQFLLTRLMREPSPKKSRKP